MSLPTVVEPLLLPDIERPEQMPCLPAWIASRVAWLRREMQRDKGGKYRQVETLPRTMMLTEKQRDEVTRHLGQLECLFANTSRNDRDTTNDVLRALTKLLMGYSNASQSDLIVEAKAEAYSIALEDLPGWAVRAAIRHWHCGTCGLNERGEAYNSSWPPSSADLRRIAWAQTLAIRNRIATLKRLLSAEALVEFDADHRVRMAARFAGLLRDLKTSPVGRNGSGGAVGEG